MKKDIERKLIYHSLKKFHKDVCSGNCEQELGNIILLDILVVLRTGRQLDPGPLGVGVVGDDGGVVAGGSGHLAAVAVLLLEVADDGSLGHGAHGHHVADGQLGALAAVHELPGVHALDGDEQLLADLVSGKRGEKKHLKKGVH